MDRTEEFRDLCLRASPATDRKQGQTVPTSAPHVKAAERPIDGVQAGLMRIHALLLEEEKQVKGAMDSLRTQLTASVAFSKLHQQEKEGAEKEGEGGVKGFSCEEGYAAQLTASAIGVSSVFGILDEAEVEGYFRDVHRAISAFKTTLSGLTAQMDALTTPLPAHLKQVHASIIAQLQLQCNALFSFVMGKQVMWEHHQQYHRLCTKGFRPSFLLAGLPHVSTVPSSSTQHISSPQSLHRRGAPAAYALMRRRPHHPRRGQRAQQSAVRGLMATGSQCNNGSDEDGSVLRKAGHWSPAAASRLLSSLSGTMALFSPSQLTSVPTATTASSSTPSATTGPPLTTPLAPTSARGEAQPARHPAPTPRQTTQMATEYHLRDFVASEAAMAVLRQERAQIQESYDETVHEVTAIQSRVTEVSHLMKQFAEHVDAQQLQIETISATTIEALDNITAGNKDLRETVGSSRDFRLFLIVFFAVINVTLYLFHWINP